ncbi:universal stress protein UspA [Pseudomonas sp. v388]|uniref:universal stress protein n=1 Tax=Pseudomonas sp. v388 TaxID=2479849 RepID=UPI000F770ABA|nr:universal stress protein [Pseudomonas sp. v388]RRV05566.1 universal stress protein UspA [Pseudomonas sp. v388]
MQSIRSILVVIEPDHPDSLALKRACLLAEVTQAHLHLLVCTRKPVHDLLLEDLRAGLVEEGFTVSIEQDWDDSAHKTIIKAQQARGCDLVVKQHLPDNPLKKALLTPDDWKLLRYCPSQVLMVKTERPWTGGVVLAAVDLGNREAEHKALHYSIVDYGHGIAALAQGELYVVTAYPSPMLAAADPIYRLRESIEARYRDECQAFQAQFDVDTDHLHIAEGPADVLIPHTAHHLQAVLTIIGTVARSGLSGALIGNTAEAVLDALESDVLVLKTEAVIAHLEEGLRKP